jgi:hypothetical protein
MTEASSRAESGSILALPSGPCRGGGRCQSDLGREAHQRPGGGIAEHAFSASRQDVVPSAPWTLQQGLSRCACSGHRATAVSSAIVGVVPRGWIGVDASPRCRVTSDQQPRSVPLRPETVAPGEGHQGSHRQAGAQDQRLVALVGAIEQFQESSSRLKAAEGGDGVGGWILNLHTMFNWLLCREGAPLRRRNACEVAPS